LHTTRFYSLSLSHSPSFFFFFNDPPPTEIYTLSLHDALPIFESTFTQSRLPTWFYSDFAVAERGRSPFTLVWPAPRLRQVGRDRSEEHTSELQSLTNLVCRLLLEKKKQQTTHNLVCTCSLRLR